MWPFPIVHIFWHFLQMNGLTFGHNYHMKNPPKCSARRAGAGRWRAAPSIRSLGCCRAARCAVADAAVVCGLPLALRRSPSRLAPPLVWFPGRSRGTRAPESFFTSFSSFSCCLFMRQASKTPKSYSGVQNVRGYPDASTVGFILVLHFD